MRIIFSSYRFVVLPTLLFFLFYFNAFPQNYWERTSGPGTVTVYDFIIENEFILIGTWHGGMYKSTNEGKTWEHLENEFSSSTVSALKLLSNGNILAGTGEGLYISSDNGETWFYSGFSDYLVSTIVIDELGSIYVGSVYGEDIYRSDDNGISWTPLNSGLMGISSIVIKDTQIILVSSSNGTYRSSDKGENWIQVLSPEKLITDLAINTNGKFSAVSERETFYISSDEGVNWDSISTLNHTLRIIYCSSNGELYAGSYGVYHSIDEGQSWNLLSGFQGCGLVRSIAESGNSFYAGSYFSGVFRSTDSGNNWFQSSKGINSSTVNLLAKGLTGKIYAVSVLTGFSYTSDNGDNWFLLSPMGGVTSSATSPNGSIFVSSGGVLIGAILRSTDSGYNWTDILDVDSAISQVNVNLDESVYAIINYKLFKSSNNGDDWSHIQVSTPDEYIHQALKPGYETNHHHCLRI